MSECSFPIIRLLEINLVDSGGPWPAARLAPAEYMLLLPLPGRAAAVPAGRRAGIPDAQACPFFCPGTIIEKGSVLGRGGSCYCVRFHVDQAGKLLEERLNTGNGPEGVQELHLPSYPDIVNRISELYKDISTYSGYLERLRQHICFQELMYEILTRYLLSPSKESSGRLVERTIVYMEREYASELHLNKLSAMAGLGRVQYGIIFKELTGKTPLAYLTELRLNRAKELLQLSDAPLREIAHSVGIRDEYYFNRRFKQMVGMSPRQYHMQKRAGLRVVVFHYLGELLALGVQPVGSDERMRRLLAPQVCGLPLGEQDSIEEKITGLKPDLIIYPDFIPESTVRIMERVAPAIVVNWRDDVYLRLNLIAGLLGKTREALMWIREYKRKYGKLRQQLQGFVREGETATALAVQGDSLYVYGAHQMGHTLYQALGFSPPDAVRKLIEGDRQFTWLEISRRSLPRFAGDRLFLVVTEPLESRRAVERLVNSSSWRELPAVRNGRAYVLDERLAYDNPITLEHNLEEMRELLSR